MSRTASTWAVALALLVGTASYGGDEEKLGVAEAAPWSVLPIDRSGDAVVATLRDAATTYRRFRGGRGAGSDLRGRDPAGSSTEARSGGSTS